MRELVAELAARQLATGRTVGLAVAATDRDGVILESYHGWADREVGRPVDAASVFQIGSISKVVTAILAVQEWEAGRLDPHAPVREYVPWLPAEPYARLTAHRLLSHTAGLHTGSDLTPSSPYMALTAVFPPAVDDESFSYGNANFQVMAVVVAELAGRPYADLVRERFLDPLGMTGSFPVIDAAARRPMATGYSPSPDDRPFADGDELAPAPFFEYTAGDGSLACTATDLAAFARMLLNGGAPVLTPAGFELLTTPVADTGDGEHVCYGVFAGHKYDYADLNHSGNMVGYDSMLCVDPATGLGAVTLTTGIADSVPVARAVLAALRDEHAGRTPTLPPPPPAPKLLDYAGTYGDRTVEAFRDRLTLDRQPLRHVKGDLFMTDGSPLPVRFGRQDGVVVELAHGPGHWVRGGYTGETGRPHPPEWDALAGQYRSHGLFEPTFRVLVRNGELVQSWPFGREQRWEPDGELTFRSGRDVLTFDTPAGNLMLRAVFCGCPYYRTFSPA